MNNLSKIDKNNLLLSLYPFYKNLLTENQKQYFNDYYFYDLSLTEISENRNVSRNAVHLALKNIEKKLIDLEQNLQLYKKSIKRLEIIEKIEKENKIDLKKLKEWCD